MSTLSNDESIVILKKYLLPRSDGESRRLNVQHAYLTATVTDGRLIYDKDVQLKPGSRVLDSGTGSGSWVLALAREVDESIELVGADISSSMFPKSHPANVRFTEASVTGFPEAWTNSFDFINQRLLIAALTAPHWVTAISELFRVLKPGGTIQLIDISPPFPSGETLKKTEKMTEMGAALSQKRGLLLNCAEEMPNFMRNAGFVDIRTDLRGAPVGKSWGEIGMVGAENFRLVFRGYGAAILSEGGLGLYSTQDEVNEVVEAARKEWDVNAGLCYNIAVIVGRKPL